MPPSGAPGLLRGCLEEASLWPFLEKSPPGPPHATSCPWWHLDSLNGGKCPPGRGALGRRGRLAGEGAPGQVAASPSPPHRKARPRLGRRTVGRLAGSSPRKWLTQRLRRALGMLQMVEHRCRMDRGCPAGSPEPASVLSYFTPFSKIFATWKGSPQKAPHQSTRLQPSRGSVYFAAMRK